MGTLVKPQRFLVDKRGRPTAVVLSLVNYRKLVHLIEDLADACALKRAIRTSRTAISYDQLFRRLSNG